MLRLLLLVSLFFTEKGSNGIKSQSQTVQTTANIESSLEDSTKLKSYSPYVVSFHFPGSYMKGTIPPYYFFYQSPQTFEADSPKLVRVSEVPSKYPYAGILVQVPATSLPTVSSSSQFQPQTVTKPTATYGYGTNTASIPGITAASGTQYGLGPLSESYNHFLGITSPGEYGGTTTGTGTTLTGSTGTVAVTNSNFGQATNSGLHLGSGSSRPSVIAGSSSGYLSSPQSSFTGYNGGYYQPHPVSQNVGSYGSSGCPSHVSLPGATCLQVGPQPSSGTIGGNHVQINTNSGSHPTGQVTYVITNGTTFGYEGLSSTVTTPGSGSGGTSGAIQGTGTINFNPQPTPSSSGSSVSNLVSVSGGTSGLTGGTGAITFVPQITSPTGSAGNQIGLPGSSISNPGSGSGTIGATINFVPQTTPLPGTQSGSTNSQGNYQVGSSGVISGTNVNSGTGNPTGSYQVTVPGSGGTVSGAYSVLSSQLTPGTGSGSNSGGSGGVSGVSSVSSLQTATQSQPYHSPNNYVQTVVCVTPELCSGFTSQQAATDSGGTYTGNGILCTPSSCHTVSAPVSGDYHVPSSVNGLRAGTSINGSVADDT